MARNKTNETEKDVAEFLRNIENEKRRSDGFALVELFRTVTDFEPKMWGPTIVGFGKYHYKYESGHEGDAPLAAFSPRKDSLVLYFGTEYKDRDTLLSKLGKYRISKGCVYVKRLENIDLKILARMIRNSMAHTLKLYPN